MGTTVGDLTDHVSAPGAVAGALPFVAGRLGVRAVPAPACGVTRCEPGWSWQPRLEDHDLWFVVHGRGEAQYLDEVHDLHPGSLLWLRPGSTGRFTQDPHHRLTVVSCHFDLVASAGAVVRDLTDLPGPYVEITDIAALSAVLHRLVRVMHQLAVRSPRSGPGDLGPGRDRWARVEAEGLLLQALAMIGHQ